MGKIEKVFCDKLISEIPDRSANRLKVQQAPNGEITIHFRNLKIVLLTEEERREWVEGFKIALENFEKQKHFKQDI